MPCWLAQVQVFSIMVLISPPCMHNATLTHQQISLTSHRCKAAQDTKASRALIPMIDFLQHLLRYWLLSSRVCHRLLAKFPCNMLTFCQTSTLHQSFFHLVASNMMDKGKITLQICCNAVYAQQEQLTFPTCNPLMLPRIVSQGLSKLPSTHLFAGS